MLPAGTRVLVTLLAQGGDLPEQTGDFSVSPTYFIALFGIGFIIGVAGHLFKSRTLVATGVALVFIATLALPLAYAVFE